MQTATADFNPHDHNYHAILFYWRKLLVVRGVPLDEPITAVAPHLLVKAAEDVIAKRIADIEYNKPENVTARDEADRRRRALESGECVRDTPLNENEVALFTRLKLITDTKKLQARLPAWIKKHQKSVQPPKQFEFVAGAKPVYPAHVKACFTRQSDTGIDRQYPSAYDQHRPACIWHEGMSTAQYIAAYYALNPNAGGRSAGTVLYSNVN